jgi:DNA-directed RNA polymerase subunit L
MKKNDISETEIEFQKRNWFLLEAKRYYQPNSYDFTIETVGVFENTEIVIKACYIMISKCEKFLGDLQHGKVAILPSETTLKNGFDVTLANEDYTLGKVIEFYLYQQNFIVDKTLSFCGFRKMHPHDNDSIIRVAFHNEIDPVGVSGYIQTATDNAITVFKKMVEQMGGDLKKTERMRLSSVSKPSIRGQSPKKDSVAAEAEGEPKPDKQSTLPKSLKPKSSSSKMKLNLSSASIQEAFTSSKKKPKSVAGVAGVAAVEGDDEEDED